MTNPNGDGPRVWAKPIPLRPIPPTPDLSGFPESLRRHVEALADHLQTPTELPLVYGLGAISTAASRRFVVRAEWLEPVMFWGCVVMEPGTRKTPAEREMSAPVREFEMAEADRTCDERRRRDARRDVLAKRIKRLEDQAARCDDPAEGGATMQELDQAKRELEETPPGHAPRLLADDSTPERLVGLMAENDGRIAVLSAEPGVLAMMAGRYTDQEQSEVYRKAWSGGEPIRVDRQGRAGAYVPDPALTLAIAAQPGALECLKAKRELRGLGTLARFLYFVPESRLGSRLTGADVPDMDHEAATEYRRMLEALLGTSGRHELTLTAGAREDIAAWWAHVESELGPSGTLADVRDWGGKIVGQTLRLAGLLHLAQYRGPGRPIGSESMRPAIELARTACDHARAVFAMLEPRGQATALAEYLLGKIDGTTTVRDLWQATRGKAEIQTTDDVRELLETLEAHRFVRVVRETRTGPGRPSEIVVPNPRCIPKNPRTRISGDFGGQVREIDYAIAERLGMME